MSFYVHALAIFLKSYYLFHRTEALFFILGTFPWASAICRILRVLSEKIFSQNLTTIEICGKRVFI